MMIAPAFLLTQVDHLGHDVCNPRFTLLDWSTSRRNRWSTSPEYAELSARACEHDSPQTGADEWCLLRTEAQSRGEHPRPSRFYRLRSSASRFLPLPPVELLLGIPFLICSTVQIVGHSAIQKNICARCPTSVWQEHYECEDVLNTRHAPKDYFELGD